LSPLRNIALRNIHQILKQYWGYDAFRPLQEEIIHAILKGQDTLALMPTGGGKSLCYQVPAMAQDGLCLVISPLIALMKDQVENLRRKSITAFAIYSGMSRKEVINTFKVASESNCKFLYVSPERLETNLFKEYLPGLGINLIAVDEAHCISQWGYDFRPPYLRIAALREELPNVPILALTASATPDVQKDICSKLEFKKEEIFRQSFERPNLSYSVFKVESKINKIIDIIKKVPGTSIVYCKSRKRTKEISELLKLQNISADFYHAGLMQEERNKKQEAWINNKTRVIVCTNAFGMGIDKPDVRTVIHADVPDCLENYYQEAGRGGRDGKKSYAVLLYDERDMQELAEMATLRFPSIKDIKNVYQAVANFLQMETGTGEGQYYDFELTDFIKKFKLTSYTVLYSLKALEQDGWLSFNEQVFVPATVRFTVGKEALYTFENEHPQLEPCIKTLLRSYEGIYDQPTAISEKKIGRLMYLEVDTIKQHLLTLHRYQIIDYQPQKNSPQLFFLRSRIKVEDIRIDMAAYNKRKEQFLEKMKQMVQFVQEQANCRSKIIGVYFGHVAIKNCGICDNCLKEKATTLNKEEFTLIQLQIATALKNKPMDIKTLLTVIKGINKEKVWQVLTFLQSENKVLADAAGMLRLV
jgi:ATP-dependent DNA helicase RecQ